MEIEIRLILNLFSLILISQLLFHHITCPPVQVENVSPPKISSDTDPPNAYTGLHYDNYLKEIVDVLEADPTFRTKLENSTEDEIRTGFIAKHLELLSNEIREKLDAIKRKEVNRLRELIKQQKILAVNAHDPNLSTAHLGDHKNLHKFNEEDLKTLIIQATSDLAKTDEQRKAEFKQYEMEKEYFNQQHLNSLSDKERAEEVKRIERMAAQHRDQNVHHPGSKDQLEEVWTKQDDLDEDDFNPRTFFKMHDLNNDGFLDATEVHAILKLEVDKIYNNESGPVDMVERFEELNRMREHWMNELDRNKDSMISMREFLDSTGDPGYEKDEGWDTIQKTTAPMWSEKEFEEFQEKMRKQEEAYNKAVHILREGKKVEK